MTVEEGYKWINFLSRKLFSGAIKPQDYNIALSAVNIEFFKLKFGLPEEYQIGAPFARQAYEVSMKITDDVKHLRKRVFIQKNSSGLFPQPLDYGDFSTIRYPEVSNPENCSEGVQNTWRKIEPVTDEEYNYRLGSALLRPILKRPIVCYVNGGYEVKPDEIDSIFFTYLRLPVTPVRNYIINANDEDVPDPNNPNTELDWPITVHTDFYIRIGKYFGINLREEEFKSYMTERQMSGQ